MPGSFCPSKNSRVAPPPVERCVILSSTPACMMAATVSPPATMLIALCPARAWAMDLVPRLNLSSSKSPTGPFHSIILALRISWMNWVVVFGPMSSPI